MTRTSQAFKQADKLSDSFSTRARSCVNSTFSISGPRESYLKMTAGGFSAVRGLGFWRLQFTTECVLKSQYADVVAVNISDGPLAVMLGSQFEQLGMLRMERPLRANYTTGGRQDFTQSLSLYCDLTPAQMHELVTRRPRGTTIFSYVFDVTLRDREDDRTSFKHDQAELRFVVKESDWTDEVKASSFQNVVLLELPSVVGSDPRLAGAVAHYMTAHDAFVAKDYLTVILNGRKLVDSLDHEFGDERPVQNSFSRAIGAGGTGAWQKHERVRLLRAALRAMSHPAAHGSAAAIAHAWNENDAAGCLLLQAGILRLMISHPEATMDAVIAPQETSAQGVDAIIASVVKEHAGKIHASAGDEHQRDKVVGEIVGVVARRSPNSDSPKIRMDVCDALKKL